MKINVLSPPPINVTDENEKHTKFKHLLGYHNIHIHIIHMTGTIAANMKRHWWWRHQTDSNVDGWTILSGKCWLWTNTNGLMHVCMCIWNIIKTSGHGNKGKGLKQQQKKNISLPPPPTTTRTTCVRVCVSVYALCKKLWEIKYDLVLIRFIFLPK